MKPMAVSIWDPAGTKGQPVSGTIKPDDDHPPIPNSWIQQGHVLVFGLRDETVYTHGGLLTVTLASGRVVEQRVILGEHIDVDIPQPVVPPVPPVEPRTGVVTTEGKAIRDANGRFHSRGATWFWMMPAWHKGGAERDRVKYEADWWAESPRRPDFFRMLGEVGAYDSASGWFGIDIDPTKQEWFDWQETLAAVSDYFYQQHGGIRLELTLVGKGTSMDYVKLSQMAVDVIKGREQQFHDIEMVNEHSSGHKVSIATMKEMAAIFRAGVPNILGLSNPGSGDNPLTGKSFFDEMVAASIAAGCKQLPVHLRRKAVDNGWGAVRQGFDCKNTRLMVTNNEPAGHASSDGAMIDPLLLAMTRIVSVVCGGAVWVDHMGTGVYGNGKAHDTAGKRPASWRQIPNIDAMLDATRNVDELIPDNVENWSVRNTQNAGVPFDLPKSMHWGAGYEDSSGFGVNKAYSAVSPTGAFIQLPCGVKMQHDGDVCRMAAKFNMKAVTVFDPLTRGPIPGLEDLSFGVGETLNLPGRKDSMVAYIIRGQRA